MTGSLSSAEEASPNCKVMSSITVYLLILTFFVSYLLFLGRGGITFAATTSGCGIYWGGNWTINTYCGIVSEVIPISKHLVILGTGSMELNGTTNLLFGFKYRRAITINNPGSSLSNYTVNVTIDTASLISAGKMRSDCGDVGFGDADLNGYPYWLETGTCNTANTRFWVGVTTIPSGTKTIYIFYGNPTATSISNGDRVFLFFDDFLTADAAKFTYGSAYCGYNPVSYSVSGSKVTIWSDNTWRILRAIMDTGPSSTNVTVVTKFNASAASSWYQNYFVQLAACDQNRYGWQDNGALGWRIQTCDGAAGCTSTAAITTLTANTWYVDEIRRNSTGCFRGKIYNSAWGLLGSREDCRSAWAPVTWTWVTWQYQTTQVQFDWIFIRRSTPLETLEPATTVSVTEESNLPQYIYIYSGGAMYIYGTAGINKA